MALLGVVFVVVVAEEGGYWREGGRWTLEFEERRRSILGPQSRIKGEKRAE